MIERPTTPAKVTLADGKERVLRYPLGVMKAAAAEFGSSLFKRETLANLDEDKLAKLIWYGLKTDEPTITVEQVENIVEAAAIPYIMQQFQLAFTGSLPEQPKNDQSGQTIQ